MRNDKRAILKAKGRQYGKNQGIGFTIPSNSGLKRTELKVHFCVHHLPLYPQQISLDISMQLCSPNLVFVQ